MRKAAPVKERRAAEIVGVVTWLILTPEHQHCDHRYLMPSQSDTPPATCQQNRENLTYGAGRVNSSSPATDQTPHVLSSP